MKLAHIAFVIVLPFLLASCLYSPGKFTSAMDVKADGSFTFAYKGEIVFLSLFQMMNERSSSVADDGKCWGAPPETDEAEDAAANAAAAVNGESAEYGKIDREVKTTKIVPVDPNTADGAGDWKERDCTKEELAERAEQKRVRMERDKEEAKKFEVLLGFNPEDEKSMQAFAAQMTKQAGWKSVVYKGKGVFDVDYQIAGKLDRDFIFPIYPDAAYVYPMILARKRADGSVQITAPAFASTNANPLTAMAMVGMASEFRKAQPQDQQAYVLADGIFTITTDAPILTNNTEDGPIAEGAVQKLIWPVNVKSAKVPEALLRLK